MRLVDSQEVLQVLEERITALSLAHNLGDDGRDLLVVAQRVCEVRRVALEVAHMVHRQYRNKSLTSDLICLFIYLFIYLV